MKRLEYKVSFVTPAFLGNAEQSAQWRTPPFKALIRQWWRVVHAPKVNFDVAALRAGEGRLFGVAADGGDSRRSLVRLRLSAWEVGKLHKWEGDDYVDHPEVKNRQGQTRPVGAQLYLGYGPLTFGETGTKNRQGHPRKGTALAHDPKRTAIEDKSSQTLVVIVPDSHQQEIVRAIALVAWFGTAGSRSRNGWGALQVTAQGSSPPILELATAALDGLTRPVTECLERDWPHAVGSDDRGPLVWRTEAKASWPEVMKELAQIKIAFRTQPALSLAGVPPGTFAKRHLLAYPVSHHTVSGSEWGNQGRLANQIRFKVVKQGAQWHGVIVHLPCRLPAEMAAALPPQQRNNLDATARATWREVHAVLDQDAQRIR